MWYYIYEGNKYGPLSYGGIGTRVIVGIIHADMSIWKKGMQEPVSLMETEFGVFSSPEHVPCDDLEDLMMISPVEIEESYDEEDLLVAENKTDDSSTNLQCPNEDKELNKQPWQTCWVGSLANVKELVEAGAACFETQCFSCPRAALRGNGDLEVLRYLFSKFDSRYESKKFECLKLACAEGILQHVKFFVEQEKISIRESAESLEKAIQANDLQYWIETRLEVGWKKWTPI